jgi:hypothetical protein
VNFVLAEKIGREIFDRSFTFNKCLERAHLAANFLIRFVVIFAV